MYLNLYLTVTRPATMNEVIHEQIDKNTEALREFAYRTMTIIIVKPLMMYALSNSLHRNNIL